MIDASTTAFERRVYYLQLPRGMGMPGHARTGKEEIQVGQEEGGTGNHRPGPLLWFSWGKQLNRFKIDQSEKFQLLWERSLVV